MYRIMWRNSPRNYSGNGEYCVSYEVGCAWIEKLNAEYPEIKHWLDPMPPDSLNLSGHRCSYGDVSFTANISPASSP